MAKVHGSLLSKSTGKTLPGQDCYFYYYSSCSRAEDCPFRHEPLALSNETVCTYWREGNCTKDHCIFRHLEVSTKKRNVTSCYWESQPQGCAKPHCPFLHQKPKDPIKQPLPSQEAKTSKMSMQLDAGSIIVNPEKLDKLTKVVKISSVEDEETGVRRLVVPAGSGHIARQTITGGIKSRLGHTGGVKARLGRGEFEEEEENNSEEENLRLSAMRTLDLRGRIHSGKGEVERKVMETEEDPAAEGVKRKELIRMREKKIKELLEQQEMDRALYKAEKKAKKKEKIKVKSQVTAVLSKADLSSKREARRLVSGRILEELPSASDYSDLDSPDEDAGTMKVISRTDRGGTLQSDLAAVNSKTSAKMRLGGGGLGGEDQGDLRARMRDKRDRMDRQSYAARVLGDLVGGEGEKRLMRKRRSDPGRDEDEGRLARKRRSDPLDSDDGNERPNRKRRSDPSDKDKEVKRFREESPIKIKKKKSKEKKEKKSKKAKRSHSPNEDSQGSDRNALQMAQEFSKEYEPIRSRKMKIKKSEDHDDAGLSLDTSLETGQDQGNKHEHSETSGDVMKDLDDFLND